MSTLRPAHTDDVVVHVGGPRAAPSQFVRELADVAVAIPLIVAAPLLRRWHRRWGATDAELEAAMPGDELVPGCQYRCTRAITIDAPPAAVWPWLVQVGFGKAGFYSNDLLDNVGHPSADRILQDFQHPAVGDWVPMFTKVNDTTAFRIASINPAEELVWVKPDSTWAWTLTDISGRTRLITRLRILYRWQKPAAALMSLVLNEFGDFPMMRKMLRTLKQRAEAGPAREGLAPVSLGPQLLPRRQAPHRGTSLPRAPGDRRASALQAAALTAPVLGVCLVIVALHLAVVAVLFPGGASVVLRAAVLLCAVLGSPVLLLWLVRASRVARVIAVGLVGLGASIAGLAASVPHVVLTGASGSNLTGIFATFAGAVLVGFAFREALRGRRLAGRLVFGTLGAVVIVQWLIAPAVNVGLITNAPRPAVAGAATLGYAGARDVSFRASDGVRLAGWYVPGRKSAAVILLHGSHGTRSDALVHLRMLVSAGYGVLAFDARGHGQSQGETNALGWSGARDLAGAVGFLERQPGVDPRRIAALGLSMGAEEALRAGATGVPLSAIVAEGAGASTLSDDLLLAHGPGPVFTSMTWLTMRGTELVSGETEPTGLSRLVGRIRVPVLLIASNASGERTIDRIYRDRIGRNASLWYVPDAGHTGGLSARPAQYAARVCAFLARALRGGQTTSR